MKKLTLGAGIFMLGLGLFAATPALAAPASLSILYSQDMSVGSTGPQATELQAFLGEQGYFTLPLGVQFGYMGAITKNALMRYQTSVGLPATGYFGAETKAAIQNYLTLHCFLGACM